MAIDAVRDTKRMDGSEHGPGQSGLFRLVGGDTKRLELGISTDITKQFAR
jgi:hypothetical protein